MKTFFVSKITSPIFSSNILVQLIAGGFFLLFSELVFSHGVDDSTKQFLLKNEGAEIIAFVYIGAKHMVTGYDHLLFLVCVIFFLYKTKDILIYVSLFTIGHSTTLLLGVFNDIQVDAFLIDAIIGFSIVYKGFDNLGGFRRILNFQPNTRIAVTIFGLFHGLGLATKLQDFDIPEQGLMTNIISFNLGVEIGQVILLSFVLIFLSAWRRNKNFLSHSIATNTLLMSGGMLLMLFQLTSFVQFQ